jgi:TonB-linked SusC/RagA family outer membrane protein
MIMRLTAFLIIISTLSISAKSYSQKINLSLKDSPLATAFSQIRQQSGYSFLWTEQTLEGLPPVTVSVHKASLQEALEVCLRGLPLTYNIHGNVVYIERRIVPFLRINPSITPPVAPEHEVTGRVTDAATGKPLIGVTIQVKGSTTGTTTGPNGSFSLQTPDNAILVISYLGYTSKEIPVNGKAIINVSLSAAATALNQLVVIGYGTEKAKDLTGAVSQISGQALQDRALTNVTQGLEGTIPGLNIVPTDGKPIQAPTFNIRGTTSIGEGGSALVLIDGVEGDPSMLDPSDIASITVLKDAASAAIYGARGAYGVVLITTKNPKKGKTSITYSSNYSFKSPTAFPHEVTNGYQYVKNFSEAWSATYNYTQIPQNINKTQKFSQQYLDAFQQHDMDPSLPKVDTNSQGQYVYYGNTDWYALLYKPHNFATDQNLSISGGSDKATYMVTGRYYNQSGLFRYNSDNYTMYNFRAKGSVQLFPWLEVNNNTYFTNMRYHNPVNVGEGGGIWRNLSDEGHPSSMLLNPDGTLTYSAAYTVGDQYYGKNGINFNNSVISNTTAFVAHFLQDHFTVNGNFTFQSTSNNQQEIQVPVPYSPGPGIINYVGNNTNNIQVINDRIGYIAANLYGSYENTFNNIHHFKAMIGYNFEQNIDQGINMMRNGLIYPDAQNISLALGQAITTNGTWNQWDILGGFFRLNYSFKDKYLVEVNGRYDGSSKFPTNQQFGFFPSVSAGWRISKEAFWHVSPKAISDLKLRASYGSLGNGNINPYSFLETFNITQSGRVINGQLPQQTSQPGVIPNGLTWETSTTEDLGMDVSALDYRLTFSGDIYVRRTTNMFTVGPTLPDVFGTTVPKGNYADLKTSGWEFSVNWQNQFMLKSKSFHYNIGVGLSNYSAIITKYNNPNKYLSDYYVGEKIGQIWGFVNDGFWTSKDVSQAATMMAQMTNGSSVWLPGDPKYKDLNHDGVIGLGAQTVSNPGDMTIIGNTTPKYVFNINLSADWNSFFFSAFFQGVGHEDWYPSTESDAFWGMFNRPYNPMLKSQVGKMWTEQNPNAYFPRLRGYEALSPRVLSYPQTGYLQNAAYIRLKSIQFGYNLPERLISKIKMSNAKLYVSGENLWVWSPMFKVTADNIDPESIHGSDRVLTSGGSGDAQNYPILKSLTFGLSVTF